MLTQFRVGQRNFTFVRKKSGNFRNLSLWKLCINHPHQPYHYPRTLSLRPPLHYTHHRYLHYCTGRITIATTTFINLSITILRSSLVLLHHYRVLPRKYYHPHQQPLPNHSHYPHHHHFLISPTITFIVIPTSLITITTIITTTFPYVILDSLGLWNPCCGFRISGPGFRIHCQLNLDSRFQSLAGFCIPRTRDSRFHKQTFPGFQILQPNFRGISEDSLGFWNPCCGFWTPGPGFPIPSQWNLDFGSQSLAGFRIPRTPDSKFHKPIFLDFRFYNQTFAGFRKKVLDSGFQVLDSGFLVSGTWIRDPHR